MNRLTKFFSDLKASQERVIVYGITDTRRDPWYVKFNDFLIDHSSVKKKEKSVFFYSLQMLVASGLRLVRAVEILAERSRNKRFQRILATIAYDMKNSGLSFSQAMAKYPGIFSDADIKMIYSGELSGKTNETLESIALQIQKNIKLDTQVKSALMYPLTVLGALILAGVVVMVFIVPKFLDIFSQFGADLPWMTKVLVSLSAFFTDAWWVVIALVVGGIMLFRNWRRTDAGRKKWDAFMLRLPLLKTLIRNIQTVRIANNLSTLLASGIAVTKSLHIMGQVIQNSIMSQALFAIERKVIKGVPIHMAFREEKHLDSILSEVIEIGEKSGKIPEILKKTGTQYEVEVDAQLKNLTTLIEPLVIIVVGVAVIFMALAIMTPIFRLQEIFTTAGA